MIDKTPKSRRHVDGTRRTRRVLTTVYSDERVDQEAPVDVAAGDLRRNEPEPDVLVLNRSVDGVCRNPLPSEIALVVEVADATLQYDLTTKAALYARAGIPECWVLDINGERLVVLRDPADGAYRTRQECGRGDQVTPLGSSQTVAVDAMLP